MNKTQLKEILDKIKAYSPEKVEAIKKICIVRAKTEYNITQNHLYSVISHMDLTTIGGERLDMRDFKNRYNMSIEKTISAVASILYYLKKHYQIELKL